MKNNKPQQSVHCPTCQKSVVWDETQIWKPFCSERCKLIDLGEWINEKHHIPGEPTFPGDEDS